jgi:nucleotide sugar dehydrogenase
MVKVGIVGLGYVGKVMFEFFSKKYDTWYYDTAASGMKLFLPKFVSMERINTMNLAVVCVPTAMKGDGSCDTSIVEKVVGELETDLILIKSTVTPGTTDKLMARYPNKRIVFSPEYCGESTYNTGHDFVQDASNEPFYIFGGDSKDTSAMCDLFAPIAGPTKTYYQCTAIEAELIKYMENAFLGTKVVFTYEMDQICKTFGADFHKVREGWLLDPRINRSHTAVFNHNKEPFGGKCLPKDINAIVKACRDAGYDPRFLAELLLSNDRIGEKRCSSE